jgi:hypothetical protein
MQFQQERTMKWSHVTWRLVVTLCVLAMAPAAVPATSRPDVSDDGGPAAATRISEAAHPVVAQIADPGRAQSLVGHWRNTQIVFGSARDENIVLRANGVVEKWSVTASSRSSIVRGRWETQANIFSVDWEDGTKWSGPFTFHQGNLVFPNRQGQRRFWDRIE